MNATRDVQSTLDAWFATGSNVAPEGSIERALVAAVARPQDRRRIGWEWRPMQIRRGRALVAAAAIVGIAASLSLGPWSGRPSVAPAFTPSTTSAPGNTGQPTKPLVERPSPSPTIEPRVGDASLTQQFTSIRHRYTIRYPEPWTLEAAPSADEPDRIKAPPPSTAVLSIRRSPLPGGQDFLAFAEEHLRHRAEPDGCRWNAAGIIFIPTRWDTLHEITVDGHRAAYRSECGFVDAVIEDYDEFLGIALKSGNRKATGDVWWFERFVETLEFADDSGS
jgi:hypothetical protein